MQTDVLFRTRSLKSAMLVAVLLGFLFQARADENYFGYSYGAETLAKGHWEVYQWSTYRTGKADGTYHALDLQTEIEHGFTDRLQGSLYLNADSHYVSNVSDFENRDHISFNGIQGSLKYNLTSPYKDGFGLAVYLEPGYKLHNANSGERVDTFFLEPKLILQKNFLDDSVIWVTNFSGEFEREHHLEGKFWESELELQLSTGVSYRFAPNWFAGLEALGTSAFEHMHLDALGEYSLFAGPNLHYANRKWWATLTVLPQLSGWPETKGIRDLDHYEKLQVRLKVGVNF